TADADLRPRTRGVGLELVTAGQPHREVPARRMSDGDDALEVEPAIRSGIGNVSECVNGPRDIEQRRRPAAAVAHPAVLDVPGGDAVFREIGRKASTERPAIA